MSLQVSAVPISIQNSTSKVIRPSADYHPTIWGDYFLTCVSELKTVDTKTQQKFEQLKQEVRGMLMATLDKPQQKLYLIDAVQRLGVAYHFEREIEDELEKIHHDCYNDTDLYTVALRFRLLRQQGINVSCDIFNKFKDDRGDFKASLISDVPSMLSLYEAAFLGVNGENILDEALTFTTTHLGSTFTHPSHVLAEQVIHALNRPIQKGLPRLEARHYISVYPRDELHNKTLIKFAKLDFNILQAQHQKELCSIIQWWKKLDFATKLPYARDRVVECYFWSLGVYFEPQFSLARKIVNKIIAMASILDDTYDAHGTFEELKLLTEAIKRWDVSAIDILPEYMKVIYQALLDVFGEFEEELAKEGRSYHVHYAKEEMKKLSQAYFTEARWCNEDYVPTFEEYMNIALVTSAYSLLATTSFLGMGEIANKEAFDWITSDPKIIKAVSVICRLMDDIVSHEFEQKRGHVASAVECYMKQHGVSKEEVVRLFRKEVATAWKDINEECLKPTVVPMPLIERILNLTRAIDVIYKDDDSYTNAHLLKDCIASLLKDPCQYE